MTPPQSVFKGLAQDRTLLEGSARAPHRNPLSGKVLFHDTFDDGFCGWRDHYHGYAPSPPLSLTSYPVFSGSHALMLGLSSPPDAGYTNGWGPNNNPAAFKNLSRYFDEGLVTFSCYLTTGTNEPTDSLGGVIIMIDTQFWDDTERSFFKLQYHRNNTTGERALSVLDDNEEHQYLYIGKDLVAGDNDNKFNFNWISITVDLDANAGLGGYHSCQVNNRVFDLTGIGGSAHHAPQTGTPIESFAGGLNFGIIGYAGAVGTGDSFLVIDQAVATVNEVL